MTHATIGTPTPVHLNGATIMTTPTDQHVRIARATGYAGVEVRAERLLEARGGGPRRPPRRPGRRGLEPQRHPAPAETRREVSTATPGRRDGAAARRSAARSAPPTCSSSRPGRPAPTATGRSSAMRDGLAILRDKLREEGIGIAFEFLGFADCPIDTPELAGRVVATCPASTSSSTPATGTRAARVRSTRSRSTASPWST